eukprot:3258493-Rhodomonas_salina.1
MPQQRPSTPRTQPSTGVGSRPGRPCNAGVQSAKAIPVCTDNLPLLQAGKEMQERKVGDCERAVSYTHLTLPTICSV